MSQSFRRAEPSYACIPKMPNRSHPKNVDGPFYVEYGCCTACDLPRQEAPNHFAYDGDDHCYICRQPGNLAETTDMIGIAWAAELRCIRYRGNDADVLRRFAELDLRELCDIEPLRISNQSSEIMWNLNWWVLCRTIRLSISLENLSSTCNLKTKIAFDTKLGIFARLLSLYRSNSLGMLIAITQLSSLLHLVIWTSGTFISRSRMIRKLVVLAMF